MSRRLNTRGWYVLISIASDDGNYCVDVFERPEGDFGFQHFRSDPEDFGSWTPIGGDASGRCATEALTWLSSDTNATRALKEWRSAWP